MPPLPYFETLRRMLQHYLDGSVREPDQPHILIHFDDVPLVPDTISVKPAGPTTCECGRYSVKELIELEWLLNSPTQVLDFRRRKAITGPVTSSELKRWQIEQQSQCTNSACPHFRACASDGGNGAKAA